MGGDRGEQPGQLGVLAHVGLAEEDAALGVEAGGEQDRGGVVDALAQFGRVVGDRDRVQVDDAEDRRVAPVLALDVLADRADVVAEVLAAGRLDAAEDDRLAHRREPTRPGRTPRSDNRRQPRLAAVTVRPRAPRPPQRCRQATFSCCCSAQSASVLWPHSPACASRGLVGADLLSGSGRRGRRRCRRGSSGSRRSRARGGRTRSRRPRRLRHPVGLGRRNAVGFRHGERLFLRRVDRRDCGG